MSIQAMEWVLLQSGVTRSARWVLLAIAWHADGLGRNAWPSVSRLMELTRYSERQVRACLRQLAADKVLELEVGAGPGGVNRYRLPAVEKVVEKRAERGPPGT